MSVLVIGKGEMGRRIIDGLLKEGCMVNATSRSTKALNREFAGRADLVIIAVKQVDLDEVLEQIKDVVQDKLVITVVAGKTLKYYAEHLGASAHIARAMTNIGFETKDAMSAYCLSDACVSADEKIVQSFLSIGGSFVSIREDQMNAFTAAAGCGIGIAAHIAADWEAACMALGFDKKTSKMIVESTLSATVKLPILCGKLPNKYKL